MLEKLQKRTVHLSVFDYFLALFIINVFLMLLAGFFYNGTFHFWTYPFSYLGTYYTQEGLLNTTASYIYSTDMAASALIMILLANHLRKENHRNNTLRPIICFLCGSGAFIAAVSPDDTLHQFHILGSTLLVSSLWILATTYLFELHKNVGQIKYWTLQLILQVPIFAYAGTFFLSLEPTEDILQKPSLLGLAIGLLYPTYYLTKKR